MFAYNKNYQEEDMQRSQKPFIQGFDDLTSFGEQRYKIFTVRYVIEKLIVYTEDDPVENVRKVAQWHLKSTENILESLLRNKMDGLAK